MLRNFIRSRLVTPPAIWGKLQGHADFVRSGMRHGESEGWQPWLARHAGIVETLDAQSPVLPASFVLPPGTLPFAPRRFVLGAIVPSADRAGRRHALLVYQQAQPSWVERYFDAQARQPCDWLFWLSRAVARAVEGDLHPFERSVHALWQAHESPLDDSAVQVRMRLQRDAQSREAGAADPAAGLVGVRHLPWADWPARLHRGDGSAPCAFWQQDAMGGFVNASHRLDDLWGAGP